MPVALRESSASQPPTLPHTKVTRADWLDAALQVLTERGVEDVRVLTLADRLGVARSSFYWYFKSRENLLEEMLAVWSQQNTASIVGRARTTAPTIASAVLGVFECWTDGSTFDARLDFAVREWAKRDPAISTAVADADDQRIKALAAMYRRHAFGADSLVRARVLYYTQVGYYALGVDESTATRLSHAASYVRALTGQDATRAELRRFADNLELLTRESTTSGGIA